MWRAAAWVGRSLLRCSLYTRARYGFGARSARLGGVLAHALRSGRLADRFEPLARLRAQHSIPATRALAVASRSRATVARLDDPGTAQILATMSDPANGEASGGPNAREPGPPAARWQAVAFAVAVFALATLYCTGLGGAFGNGDEAIYAEMIRAMQRSGQWLRLEYLGAELLQRPPTSVTLYALVSRVVPGELGVRLLPAILTLATYVLVGAFVWRRTERVSAGVIAMVVGAMAPTVFTYGRVAFSDPPFVLGVTVALLATVAARRDARWLPWAGAGLGAAFAVKSLAAAIPALALAPWLVDAARHHRVQRGRLLAAAGVFAALALPYYVVSFAVHGRRFYTVHIERILIQRATGGLESIIGLRGGRLAYVRHVEAADGVILAALLGAAVGAAILLGLRARDRDRDLLIPGSAALVMFVALSAMGTRLAHYLLPVYPAAAVCLGLLAARAAVGLAPRTRLAPPMFVAAALTVAALNLERPHPDASIQPSPATRALGRIVAARIPPQAPIYTLDWYAPALGYYADRRWHQLVQSPRLASALGNIDPFQYTGTVHAVPPYPLGDLYVVTFPETLDGASLEVREILAQQSGLVLVRARARL